jgi:streptomycin 6-kinase
VSIAIPPVLARNVLENWAATGSRWLADLPSLLEEAARRWDLTLGRPYDLSLNWVTRVTRADGSPAVLKLGVADGHLATEAQALRISDGHGAVRLLAEDHDLGAILIEQAVPGIPATALVPSHDEVATAAIIVAAQNLHRPPPPGCTLPHLRAEAESFRAHLARYPGDDPLPRRLVERAAGLFDDLCRSAPEEVVLHGDLHHDNVLSGDREPWLAIDPFGLVGDPGYDGGAMLYNPDPARRLDDLVALVPARLEQLADGLAIPLDRLTAWGFVKGVLSEVWTAEGDGTPGGRALDVANLLWPRVSRPAPGR